METKETDKEKRERKARARATDVVLASLTERLLVLEGCATMKDFDLMRESVKEHTLRLGDLFDELQRSFSSKREKDSETA